jgi:hypothetical protein
MKKEWIRERAAIAMIMAEAREAVAKAKAGQVSAAADGGRVDGARYAVSALTRRWLLITRMCGLSKAL